MPFVAPESDIAQQPESKPEGFTAPASDVDGGGFVSTWEKMSGAHMMGYLPGPRATVTGARLALETIPVGIAQAVGGPALGAAVGGFTNLLGQGLENVVFDKNFDPVENAGAAAYGAIPIGGEIARAKTLLGAGGEALREGARIGGATTLIETPKVAAEKGRVPTPEEMLTEVGPRAALGFAAGTAGGMMQQRGQEAADRAKRAINFLQTYQEAGIRPTPGMVMPNRLAGMERRMLEASPVNSPAASMEEAVYRDLKQGLDDIVSAPQQKPEVYQNYAAQIQRAREMADSSLERQIKSTLDQATSTAIANATKTGAPMDDAAARDVMKGVANKVKEAYDAHWDKMFGMFDREAPIYNASTMYNRVKDAFEFVGKKDVPVELQKFLGADNNYMTSRENLSMLQDIIAKRGRVGDIDLSTYEGKFKKLSGELADDINREVNRIYPTEIADQYRNVNKDYRDYLDLWRAPGVQAIFEAKPDSEVVKRLVNGVIENGVKSDDYSRISALIQNLKTPKAASEVIETEGGKMLGAPIRAINLDLADSLQQHVNSLVRSNIIHSASDNGAVNASMLVSRLKKLGNDPQALKTFGFGDASTIKELEVLAKDHPAASKLTVDQWSNLLSSPAFKNAIESGTSVASVIQPALAGSSAQNNMTRALFFRSAGDLENANKYLRMAQEDAASLGISFDATQKKYDGLAKLPDYAFFNKPGGLAPQDYNSLIRNVSDTSANAVTNNWVKELKATLESNSLMGGKDLLKGLQRGYIQDHLAGLESSPRWSQSPTRVNIDNLAEFFAPNSKRGAEELARAKSLLEPEQLDALQKSLRAASALRYYERAAGEVKTKTGRGLSDRNLALRGWDAIGDKILKNEWETVAEAITNPAEFENRLYFAGQQVKELGQTLERAVPSLQRFLPQQQQAPAFLNQFSQPQPSR